MGRPLRKFDAAKVATLIALGFGQGTGSNYKPWLSFNDISSRGTTTRLFSPKVDRKMTFFSNVERNAFFVAEHCKTFLDYHEQGPMSTEITLDIARELGVRHPMYRGGRVPAVLTYDGLFFHTEGSPQLLDCKHSRTTDTYSQQVAYAMRHEFARRMNYEILRITDQSFSRPLIQNLTWIRQSAVSKGTLPMPAARVEIESTRLLYEITRAVERGETQSVTSFLADWTASHAHPTGLGLFLLRRMIWLHHIDFNLEVHHDQMLTGPLHNLSPDLQTAFREAALT